MQVRRAKRDIIAEFYDALEEMGEYCDFFVGRYRAEMAGPEWTRFRHQEYDGASAVAELIRTKFNVDIDIETSPNPPSTWTLIVAFLHLVIDAFRRRRPMRWRRADPAWRPTPGTASPPTAVAWSLFTRQEAEEIFRNARSHRVTLQAWLLWSLKEAVASEFVPGTGTLFWYLPVNMHGAFPSAKGGNSNFALEVRFPIEATPVDVQKAIRREFRLRRHWVIAKAAYSLSWMVMRWMLRPLVRLACRQPPSQGSFSISGSTPSESHERRDDGDEWWIGLKPVVKTSPFGCSCVQWGGLLSLSMQIHPSLANDPEVARDWIGAWRKAAMGDRLALPSASRDDDRSTFAGADRLRESTAE
jgi:hypothetical protein